MEDQAPLAFGSRHLVRLVLTKRLVCCCFLGFALSVFLLTLNLFISQYSASDGVVLPNKQPVGGDFVSFWVAGRLAREDFSSLYDFKRQRDMQAETFFGRDVNVAFLPFLYPPVVASLFNKPISQLSLFDAYLLWLAISVLLTGLAMCAVLRHAHLKAAHKLFLASAMFGFAPLVINCFGAGQTACLGLAIYAFVFHFLKTKRDFLAGLVLGLCFYKPPLFFGFVLLLLVDRRYKMLAATVLSFSLLLACSAMLVDAPGFKPLFHHLEQYSALESVYPVKPVALKLGAGLSSLMLMLSPNHVAAGKLIYLALSVLFGFLGWRSVKNISAIDDEETFDLRFAFAVSLSLLVSTHLFVYDLAIVSVPLLIVLPRLWRRPWNAPEIFCTVFAALLFTEYLFREVPVAGLMINFAPVILLGWTASLVLLIRSRIGLANIRRAGEIDRLAIAEICVALP